MRSRCCEGNLELGPKGGKEFPGEEQLHWQRQSLLDSLDRAVWEDSCSAPIGSASLFHAALCPTMGPAFSTLVSCLTFKARHAKWPQHSFPVETPRVNVQTRQNPARNGTGFAVFRA